MEDFSDKGSLVLRGGGIPLGSRWLLAEGTVGLLVFSQSRLQ